MPSDSSHTNSGATTRFFSAESGSMTPSRAAVPPARRTGPATSPSRAIPPRHEAGPVHQPAQDQPVPDADDPAGAEQERPVMDRDQRLAGGHERARIPTGSSGEVLPQGHDRQEADDADGDEGAIDETSGDIAQRERFALPLEDREQGDGGADVRDDEDLEERAQGRAPGGAGTDDVVGVVQHRRVEDGRRRIEVTKVMTRSAPVTNAVLEDAERTTHQADHHPGP